MDVKEEEPDHCKISKWNRNAQYVLQKMLLLSPIISHVLLKLIVDTYEYFSFDYKNKLLDKKS